MTHMTTERVGVRALQQHASRVIRQVADGATVEVTDRGRLVARLVPVTADPLVVLHESGHARPATRRQTASAGSPSMGAANSA